MDGIKNKKWIFVRDGNGKFQEDAYRLVEESIPTPEEGEILVKALYISVDPLQQAGFNTYRQIVQKNQTPSAAVVAEVLESKDASGRIEKGHLVLVSTGWQMYACCSVTSARIIEDRVLPASTSLGILGISGVTAYFGFLKMGKPKAGQTVVVSGAAGAVGSIVVQLAKISHCRVVGIARTDEKVNYLKSHLNCDVGIAYGQYQTQEQFKKALSEACPNGIDIYYDNVGGTITDAVFELINFRARIVICGQISQYCNIGCADLGPRFLHLVLEKRAKIQGIMGCDWMDKMPEMLAKFKRWILADQLKYTETVIEGFENLPKALVALFDGFNTGKMIVKV